MPSRLRAALLLPAGLLSCLALAGCGVLPVDFAGFGGPVTISTRDAGEAARAVSAYRKSHGLGAAEVDGNLNEAAAAQARAVARAGRLSHGDFASRMARHDVAAAAENLAMGSSTVAGAMTQWRQSPPHNANLLKPDMTRIGFARAETLGPRHNTYWALVLAR